MTDEKLNQVLKDALSPKINEEDIIVKNRFALNKKRKYKGVKIGAAAAAVTALTVIGIGVFNPALAAQIPIIGHTFQNMQNDVSYSGDYTDKAVKLAESEDDKEYTAQDNGVKITASEVYCDGYSIFLAFDFTFDNKDLTNCTQHYVTQDELAYGFYANGTYTIDGKEQQYFPFNLEGNIIGNDTFAGLVKLNLDEKLSGTHTLKISFDGVGYDDETHFDAESDSIEATDWVQGKWDFDIPITVDTRDVKVVKIDKKAADSELKLNEVAISPYQIVVAMDAPMLENKYFTEEMKNEIKNDETLSEEEKEKIIEEQEAYPMWTNTLIFNQDGEKMLADWEYGGLAYFPVHNKDIKKLNIFVFAEKEYGEETQEYYMEMNKEGMNSPAAEKATIIAEADF